MGVPSFYKWLVNKYPNVVQVTNGVEYDNLYLDMNSIIHPCFHPDNPNISPPSTFEDVFRNIFDYIDRLVKIVRPHKLLYMAIDGVAPRAKMNQQRARRFKTSKDDEIREVEEERLRKKFEMEGKQVLPKQESEVSDSNIITPGTEFMHELSKALKTYISSRIASDSLWKDIMVILSDANVPGEGEHKIISYIRGQRNLPGYDPNTSHCLYGSDADLIMLALATHEPHFSILREDGLLQEKVLSNSDKPSVEFLHIWILREYLELDMKIQDPPKNFTFEFERIIDDFIFLCFFAGNDFLPHMPTLEIREGAIDLLVYVYKTQFCKLGGYLVDITRIGEKHAPFLKLSRVEKFILMVGTYEDKIFCKRSEIRAKYLRKLITDHERSEEQDAASFSDLDDGRSSDCAIIIKKAPGIQNSPGFFVDKVSDAEILQNTKDLKEQLDKFMTVKNDLFKSGEFLTDKIKLGTAGYKERYYKEKFLVEGSIDIIEKQRKDVVQKYTEGLLWVLQYYFSGVASWSWFYPYHYGPFASDLKGMGQVKANFEKGVPFSPFDQLLSVLPPRSAYAIPKSYSKLMIDEDSKILDWYPQDFEVDKEGKRFLWQGICKLPWIDERKLLTETREIQKELSEHEKIRNSVKFDNLFVRSSNSLATKICSLSTDTSISEGIGGIISLCLEDVEICDKKQDDDHVMRVNYEVPQGGSSRNHHLLSGVNIPVKTIYESDIMETVLWHERQMYQTRNRFERLKIQDKNWRSRESECSSSLNATNPNRRIFSPNNTPPEVTYRGAGVGWGSGRGKPSNNPTMQRVNNMTNERMPYLSPYNNQSFQAQTTQFGRGRGRLGPNMNNVDSWRKVSSSRGSSFIPNQQYYQVKDQNRW